jgi:arylsulfatase A-like enzyme
LFEGGHRVPFIASWPGRVRKGTTSDAAICLAGLLATCAEMFNEKLNDDAGEDSFSFLKSLINPNPVQKQQDPVCIIHQSYGGALAIRLGDWKLIPGSKILFNMKSDPYEKSNLFRKHPEIVERLASALKKYKASGRSRP